MNEINNAVSSVFILFEATINQMIDKRIEAKRDDGLDRLREENQALKVRIEALEQSLSTRAVQIEGLGIDQRDDAKRIDALENDSYEFRTAVVKIIDNHTMGDEFLNPLVSALTDNDEFRAAVHRVAKDVAQSEVEEAMDNHTSEYDHDEIHDSSEIDEEAVGDIVREVLSNATVRLDV